MTDWGNILIILSIVLLVFLLWREWSGLNKHLLWARLFAAIVAVASLYMLAMPPAYMRKTTELANSLLLLTEGSVKDSVTKKDMPVYDIRKDGVDEMLLAHKGINTIHIYGYGLEDYDLKKLSGQELVFHPAIAPIGFSRVQYRNELMQGETMELQGSFHQSDSAKTTILLMGFGSVLDSTHLDERHLFTLRYIPAQIGVATYSLIAVRGSDTLEKQILPVNVSEHQPLRVLMLGSAPGFEGRFLKDWLSGKGYRVMSRTRVNKKIYTKDFVNAEREMVDAIGSSLLDQADMVVADNGALASLSAAEIRAIKTAIREKGLGLLICVNGDESNDATGIAYRVNRMPGGLQQKLDLRLNDGRRLKPLITEDQYDIVPGDQFLPLVQNEAGKLFSAAGMEGQGRIVLNTINYSYKWKLSGLESDYDHFWWKLVSMTLGRTAEENWRITPGWPTVDEPLTVTAETEQDNPMGLIDGQKVYLQQNPQFPGQWQGRFWPRTTGWHRLKKTDGTEQLFFISDRQAWWAMRMNERIRKTREYAATHNGAGANDIRKERMEQRHLPPILFLLLFMMSAGFLWFEQKRMSGN